MVIIARQHPGEVVGWEEKRPNKRQFDVKKPNTSLYRVRRREKFSSWKRENKGHKVFSHKTPQESTPTKTHKRNHFLHCKCQVQRCLEQVLGRARPTAFSVGDNACCPTPASGCQQMRWNVTRRTRNLEADTSFTSFNECEAKRYCFVCVILVFPFWCCFLVSWSLWQTYLKRQIWNINFNMFLEVRNLFFTPGPETFKIWKTTLTTYDVFVRKTPGCFVCCLFPGDSNGQCGWCGAWQFPLHVGRSGS